MAGLLALDGAILAIAMPKNGGTVASASPTLPPSKDEHPWAKTPADSLGADTGAIYRQIKETLAGNELIYQGHRVAGNDFQLVISLARRERNVSQGFPSRVYCLGCEAERCRFAGDSLRALEGMSKALPKAALASLQDKAKATGQSIDVSFIGGASGGRVFKWREEHRCDGFGFEESKPREPPAYDTYRESECGVHSCQIRDTGQSVEIHSMDIDSNEKLACLRGACLLHASGISSDAQFPVSVGGDVALEDGGQNRGAEIVITLRNLAQDIDSDYYRAFFAAFRPAARAR